MGGRKRGLSYFFFRTKNTTYNELDSERRTNVERNLWVVR